MKKLIFIMLLTLTTTNAWSASSVKSQGSYTSYYCTVPQEKLVSVSEYNTYKSQGLSCRTATKKAVGKR